MAAAHGLRLLLTPNSAEGNPAGPVTSALDASGEKVGWVFQVEEDFTATRVLIAASALAGTSPSYTIGLQGVTSGFLPDGTYLGGGSPASKTQQLANGSNEIALDNSIALTRGQIVALVVEYSSGTINAGNAITLRRHWAAFFEGLPISLFHNGASWAKTAQAVPSYYAIGSASRWYGRPQLSASTLTTNTAGNRVAVKFVVPAGFPSLKVAGIEVFSRLVVSATDVFKVGLWDSAGAVIQDVSLDADYDSSAGNQYQWRLFFFDESSLTELTAGNTYYLGVERTGGSAVGFDTVTFAGSAQRDCWTAGLAGMATWNGSAWSDNNTNFPAVFGLILSELTAPASGGGLLTHPGMAGGMRG